MRRLLLVLLLLSLAIPADAAFTARTPTTAGTTSSASVQIDVPTGVVNGDILFLWVGAQDSTPPTVTSGVSAWTLVGTATPTGTATRSYLYYRIASGEPANYTVGFSGSAGYKRCVIIAYTSGDFNALDPVDVSSNTEYVTNDTTVRAAAMSVSDADSPLFFVGYVYTSSGRTWTAPAAIGGVSWTEDYNNSDLTNRFTVGAYSMVMSSLGSTGDINATISSATTFKHAFAVALNPALKPTVRRVILVQ